MISIEAVDDTNIKGTLFYGTNSSENFLIEFDFLSNKVFSFLILQTRFYLQNDSILIYTKLMELTISDSIMKGNIS